MLGGIREASDLRVPISWSIFCAVAGLLVVALLAGSVRAEPVPEGLGVDLEAMERQVREIQTELFRMQTSFEARTFLEEEYRLYREFIERQWDQWQRFVEWLFGIAAGVFALACAAAAFLGLRTIKGATRQIKDAVEEDLSRIASEQVKRMSTELRGNIDYLKRVVQRERSYRTSRVLATATQAYLTEMQKELSLLERSGISVKAEPWPLANLVEQVDQRKVDIVVYRYAGEENGRDPMLDGVITALTTARRRVPLCVYAPLVRVDKTDESILKRYEWYTFANTPVTLVTSVYSLTHVFCEEGSTHDGP